VLVRNGSLGAASEVVAVGPVVEGVHVSMAVGAQYESTTCLDDQRTRLAGKLPSAAFDGYRERALRDRGGVTLRDLVV
jgi:hypothetical protein